MRVIVMCEILKMFAKIQNIEYEIRLHSISKTVVLGI